MPKGIEIIQTVSYHCGVMLEINIKIYLKITQIFSGAMDFTLIISIKILWPPDAKN